MLSVLINAYACSPKMGSEPGMAWNWCINLANYCQLYIITEGEFKDKIEAVLPTLPQGKNMHFYYNPVSEEVRKMCWNQGDWRFYKFYRKWQYTTYLMALDIIKSNHIDIIHQLNMIGFREPGFLWKIKEKPLIWGPIDAKEKFPMNYVEKNRIKTFLFMNLKNIITSLQLKFGKRIRYMINKADFVVAASSNSKDTLNKYFNIASPLINETGCYIQNHPILDKTQKETLDLLWVGKMDFRKQLALAIQTLGALKNKSIILHIIGDGDKQSYQKIAEKILVKEQCIWYGKIAHEQVQLLMQKSDLLFFTSVAEGTPHVVLEAISNNLPVICFDTCGQGDVVDKNTGIKIPISNPEKSVNDFTEKINYLYQNKEIIQQLSNNCKQRQQELSWDNKAKQMFDIYVEATKRK